MPVDTKQPLALELRLFGAFDVRVRGRALSPLRYRKEQWLLALLALRHDRDVARDWLAATFWPENEESQGRFYLRKALSNLRNALGEEASRLLSPSSRTVRLDLSHAFCDVLVFDAALALPTKEALTGDSFPGGIRALRKLIFACKEAIPAGGGHLVLECD